ncbi:hypothetical protein Glove_880g21 [Diversispora epigaea]|uniref:Uncharacterized protein n=1 Tax=Diversispora epigaea TaxID=1348612 RepID=A0A397G2C6_9GLOM|nr:hypothetical protein Glove_880g19 [Diversispora epigaea]RHZ43710.1 hypothetical protein Glove_880g21 [Diversispora epigaea]
MATVKNSICYNIEGFFNCGYFNSAVELGNKLKQFSAAKQPPVEVIVETHPKDKWRDRLKYLKTKVPNSNNHQTSPFIYEDLFENSDAGNSNSKGGCDDEGCRL